MRNIKLTLQYEGGKYQGWQRQTSSKNTIQGRLEELLHKMCGHPVELHGAGRTDAGVHALGQVAHFHTECRLPEEEMLQYINRYLPEDIAVVGLKEVGDRFHSRLNAKGKTYRYRIMNRQVPDVFERRYVLHHPQTLDVKAMKEAADHLIGTHDFQAFTSAKKGKKSTVRTIEAIVITKDNDEICIEYMGNGFLYHMVRIMTGTLLEVGRGERTASSLPLLLTSGKREEAGALVPAQGLTLVEVRYS